MISTASRPGQIVRVGLPLTFIARAESSPEWAAGAGAVQFSTWARSSRPAPGTRAAAAHGHEHGLHGGCASEHACRESPTVTGVCNKFLGAKRAARHGGCK